MLKNLSRGSFYLAAEQLSGLISGILYSVIVLRWLGPESYGMLSLALAIVGLASVATGNFELFLERYSAEYETRGWMDRLRRTHFITLGLKLVLGVAVCAILLALSGWIGRRYEEPILTQLLWVLSALVVCEAFSVTGRAVLYGLQRFGWISALSLAANALKIGAVALLWLKGQGVVVLAAALVALGIGQAAVLTALAIGFVRRGRAAVGEPVPVAVRAAAAPEREELAAAEVRAEIPRDRSLVGGIVRYSLPLIGARAAFLSGQNLSRVVLGGFMSLEQLGYYSFAFTVVERFVGFVYALPSSLLPSLTQLVTQGDRLRFTRLFDKAFRLVATAAAILSLFLFLFAVELTRLVGGEKYLPAVPVLQVLALVPWVRTAQQPLTMAFYALRHTGRVLALALVKLGTEVASYFLLIPVLGMIGAAWATLAGAAIAFALALFWLGRELPPNAHRWAVVGKTSVILVMALAAAWATGGLASHLWLALGLKLLVFVPGLLLLVFLCDLVTEDDLVRAKGIEIRTGWARRIRDRVVAVSLLLSRAVEPLRPGALATAESN